MLHRFLGHHLGLGHGFGLRLGRNLGRWLCLGGSRGLIGGQGHRIPNLFYLPLGGGRGLLLARQVIGRQGAGGRNLQGGLGWLKLRAQRDLGKRLFLLLQLVAVHQIRQKNDNQGDQDDGPH
ncbi:hypothetical protein D3C84_853540 [compost metagenome]